MKTKYLIYAAIAFVAYRLFFKKKPVTNAADQALEDLGANIMGGDTGSVEGKEFSWRYVGASALRQDAQGKPIPCGMAGDPYSRSQGGLNVAPTTFYAMLELGTPESIVQGFSMPGANMSGMQPIIKVGDRIELNVTGGQFSAMQDQRVTVLQLGSDTCNNAGQIQGAGNMIVVDFPIVIEGADDAQYPPQTGSGTFRVVNPA